MQSKQRITKRKGEGDTIKCVMLIIACRDEKKIAQQNKTGHLAKVRWDSRSVYPLREKKP